MIYSRPYFNLRKYCSQLFLRSPRNVFNFINDITTIFFTHKHGFVSFLQNKYIHKESTSHPWCKVFRIDPCSEDSRTYPHWSYHAKGRHYTCMYYFPFENWYTFYEVNQCTFDDPGNTVGKFRRLMLIFRGAKGNWGCIPFTQKLKA